MIVWSADLGNKYTGEVTKLSVLEALQRTKQVVASDAGAGQKPQIPNSRDPKVMQEPDDNYKNPFALQRFSLPQIGGNLPKPPHTSHQNKNQEPKPRHPGSPSVRARTVDPETHKEMRRGRLSAPPPHRSEDDLFFRDESSSPEPAESRRDHAKKRLSLMNTGKRIASSPPPISSASPRAAKRQSRWGPDLQSGYSPEDQRLASLGEIPREDQPGSPSERRAVNNKSMSPTKQMMQDKRRSFGEQIAKAAATGFARVKPTVIHCEPEPGFIWTGKGRCLEVEFKRKLTLTEEVIVQWAEEWDMRRGIRSGPVDLERLHQLRETQDTNEAEQSIDDAKMHDFDRD
ncbi:hypothetical protein H072_6133 [Dactylellina haptotyla CBS 200.50]|uniref:Uncharacterized protein n=1 Tax=Dactylellina haptotyla (strain CBS 200.50) TaxID=1284197 RepID=S8BKW2_DACHA|nr:hypothetical protein H072_6133 [Dactylellina haptotyla CBS 200.50]